MSLRLAGLRVERGEFRLELDAELAAPATALFGDSGSGKTTLLETVAGLIRPAAGRIELSGETIDDVGTGLHVPSRRRRVGWVPQEGALFPHLSVRSNVLYGARDAPADGLARVVDAFELAPLLDRRIAGLSGGEQRRVALARALLSRPRLLLLDEPLAGLDRGRRDRILPFLERTRAEFGVPLVYVTHQIDEIAALCDEVLTLESGRLAGRAAPDRLFGSHPPAAGAPPVPAGVRREVP